MRGFTLLEVLIALAIMASVILTLLGAVNYHLGVIAAERDSTQLTILARYRLAEIEQAGLAEKSEGTFAPAHPDVRWKAEITETQLASVRKLTVKLQRSGDRREVALVRYVLK